LSVLMHESRHSRRRPANLAQMAEVHGIGEAKLARYGAEFLEVVRQHQEGE
jgi:superfamily II DNA helicase RecQ